MIHTPFIFLTLNNIHKFSKLVQYTIGDDYVPAVVTVEYTKWSLSKCCGAINYKHIKTVY